VDRRQVEDVSEGVRALPADSLRALLAQAIDYAGLFPPANLELESALRNYAEYVRHPDAWMLGPFILPVAEFDAAARSLSQFDPAHPLRISALGPRTDDANAFHQSLSAAVDSIAAFRAAGGPTVSIEQFEMPLPAELDAEDLKTIRSSLGASQFKTFWEAKPNAAERVIALIAENNGTAAGPKLGFKLRTGGITAEAFPSPAELATVLAAAGNHLVPIKFTAGLHHPVRLFHESVETRMHGFLNVLGAGILALEHNWNEREITQMLEDEEPGSFAFTDDYFCWRECEIAPDRIRAHRDLVTSLGSCSFDEPRDDLRALKLL
jgi:hypothetical protein